MRPWVDPALTSLIEAFLTRQCDNATNQIFFSLNNKSKELCHVLQSFCLKMSKETEGSLTQCFSCQVISFLVEINVSTFNVKRAM